MAIEWSPAAESTRALIARAIAAWDTADTALVPADRGAWPPIRAEHAIAWWEQPTCELIACRNGCTRTHR